MIPVNLVAHTYIHTHSVSCWVMTFLSAATPPTNWRIKTLPVKENKQYRRSVVTQRDKCTHARTYFLARTASWKNKYRCLCNWLNVAIINIKGSEGGRLLTDTAVNTNVQTNSPGQSSPVQCNWCWLYDLTKVLWQHGFFFPCSDRTPHSGYWN